MGIPLLLSSFRFYYNSILFKKVVEWKFPSRSIN
jgi:hypothetical protein